MSIKLKYIKKYFDLKPVDEITLTSGSGEEYQAEVFSCLIFLHKYKGLENKLFIEIEENSFEDKYTDYINKYHNLLKDSLIDIPEVSTEIIKKHFRYFNSFYENFDSLYKLLVNSNATFLLGEEWVQSNEKDKPKGDKEWVKIQEDIYHFTKRETVKLIKEKLHHELISSNNSTKRIKDYKSTIWFKVGILFATGKIQDLYNKYKNSSGHFKKITLELGFKESDRPYISETLSNSTESDKNIYSKQDKLKKIYDYCNEEDIVMVGDFTDKMQP